MTEKHINIPERLSAVILILTLLMCNFTPVKAREYIVYGSYPQTEVTDTSIFDGAVFDENGDTVINGTKYRRVYVEESPQEAMTLNALDENGVRYHKDMSYTAYFKYEPLYWEEIGDGLLLSRDIIDGEPYDEQEYREIFGLNRMVPYADNTSWEDSSIRSWLNSSFINTAFTTDERAGIATSPDKITLLSAEQAKALDESYRRKRCSDYAGAKGVKIYTGETAAGNGEWLLKDVSPVLASAVCTVGEEGTVNTALSVLVNDTEKGVVPCIKLSPSVRAQKENMASAETVMVYAPCGAARRIDSKQTENYTKNGWYTDIREAKQHTADYMNNTFRSSPVFADYEKYIASYSKTADTDLGASPIRLEYDVMNPSAAQLMSFLEPLIEENITGNQKDYLELSIEIPYDKSYGNSLDEFGSFAKKTYDMIETRWTSWSGMVSVNFGGNSTGTSGNDGYKMWIYVRINGRGSYSESEYNYFSKLYEIADGARAYSNRPLGQIEYIRNYLAENVVYNGKEYNNDPHTIILDGDGVCGSYANAVEDLCYILGIPCFTVCNGKIDHGWNCIFVEGDWYELDTTGIDTAAYNAAPSYNGELTGTIVYDEPHVFNPLGFEDTTRADNVNFLRRNEYGTHDGDNVSSDDFRLLMEMFKGRTKQLYKGDSINMDYSAATGADIKVLINGSPVCFDQQPIIENDRTLVPLRAIFEALGASVDWGQTTQTVTAVKDNIVITLRIGNNTMYKNDEAVSLDVPAKIVNDRTLVPVRAVSEAFGCDVSWDGSAHTVYITQ